MEIKQLGSIAHNGKYYYPKYWVMKWKDQDDVVIETASKCLMDSRTKAEACFSEKKLEDDTKYEFISIEIKRAFSFN